MGRIYVMLLSAALGALPARGADAGGPADRAPGADSLGVAYQSSASRSSPWREHAPLAWFSLGSLAIGGVFYGIQAGTSGDRVGYVAGDHSDMDLAIGAAGITALAAAAAWVYFSRRDAET